MPVDPSYQSGAAGTAPTSSGAQYSYDDANGDLTVPQSHTHSETQQKVQARIVKVNSDGSVTIATPDGKQQKITQINGQPVTRQVSQGTEKKMTGVDRNGNPTYVTQPKNVHYELNKDALPEYSESKNSKGKISNQEFTLTPGNSKEVTDNPAKLGDLMATTAKQAGSSDPKDKASFEQLQQDLYDAGFTNGQKLPKGVYDASTAKALQSALIAASAENKTLENILADGKKANPGGPAGSGHVDQLAGKEDVQNSVQKQAADILGYQPGDDVIGNIMNSYNSLSAGAQDAKAAGNAPDATGVTNVQSVPDLDSYVADQLRAQNPIATQGMQFGHHLAEFMSLLGSGGVPNSSTFGGK